MTESKKRCLCFISSDTHWCRWRWWRWLSHTIFVTRSTNWPGNSKGYFFSSNMGISRQISDSSSFRLKIDCLMFDISLNIFFKPFSAVRLWSKIASIVAKVKKHVVLTSHVVPYASFTVPKLPGKKVSQMNLREKNPPAVIRIGPPSVSLLLTVELVAAVIVWGSCAGWQGGGGRQQEQQVEHGCVFFRGGWVWCWG